MAGRFLAWARRDEEAYPSGSCRTTEKQRSPSQKAAYPEGKSTLGTFGGVAHSLQTSVGMRVARALPPVPNCSCAASSYL